MANAKGLSLRGGRRPTWQSRAGSCDFAGSILLTDHVLRDSHVASLLGMTRQGSARCTSALLRLNYPVQGAQGAPLQTQLVFAFLSAVRADRQHCAGRGMPLPYNSKDQPSSPAFAFSVRMRRTLSSMRASVSAPSAAASRRACRAASRSSGIRMRSQPASMASRAASPGV